MDELQEYLKVLRLPGILSCYGQEAEESRQREESYEQYLRRLCEREILGRQSRQTVERIKKAQFPFLKTLDGFDLKKVSSQNRSKIEDLSRGKYISQNENILAMGTPGTGKTHVAIALGIAACQQGHTVLFQTASRITQSLLEAYDEKRLLSLKKRYTSVKVLILDELGYIPFSTSGAELLFDLLSERHEKGSLIITSNLPFEEWTQTFGTARLTCALLDRLTHHAHILEMNGESYRISSRRTAAAVGDTPPSSASPSLVNQ